MTSMRGYVMIQKGLIRILVKLQKMIKANMLSRYFVYFVEFSYENYSHYLSDSLIDIPPRVSFMSVFHLS